MTVQQGDLGGSKIMVPRGIPGLGMFTIEMTEIYAAESRLKEISVVSGEASRELMGYYVDAISNVNRYLGWVTYELLHAQKYLKLAKAEVIIDKMPDQLIELKKKGQKDNADLREALVYRDSAFQQQLDTFNGLTALKAMLEAKVKTFEKAHYACKAVYDTIKTAPQQNLTATVGELGDIPLGSANLGGNK